ncbi:hypothetical protein EON67_09535 [archaeon]|nr:MAG: hypothetical protein EON67_09535 [archaeon]
MYCAAGLGVCVCVCAWRLPLLCRLPLPHAHTFLHARARLRTLHACREIVARHLLALRWMNPNAVVYLRETKGQGVPSVSFDLCTYWLRPRAPVRTFSRSIFANLSW